MLYLSSPDQLTLPLALERLQAFEPTNFPILLAGAVMVTIPAFIAFVVGQRAFLVGTVEGEEWPRPLDVGRRSAWRPSPWLSRRAAAARGQRRGDDHPLPVHR